jgi:hypothetical protein
VYTGALFKLISAQTNDLEEKVEIVKYARKQTGVTHVVKE